MMRHVADRRTVVLGLVTLGLAALGLAAPQAVAQPVPPFPYGVVFIADSLDGVAFADVAHPNLRISQDGKAQGNAGCNRYSGAVAVSGDTLVFGPMAMTRMACFGAGGDNERRFAPALATATRWRMDRGMLVLETAQGSLRFRRR